MSTNLVQDILSDCLTNHLNIEFLKEDSSMEEVDCTIKIENFDAIIDLLKLTENRNESFGFQHLTENYLSCSFYEKDIFEHLVFIADKYQLKELTEALFNSPLNHVGFNIPLNPVISKIKSLERVLDVMGTIITQSRNLTARREDNAMYRLLDSIHNIGNIEPYNIEFNINSVDNGLLFFTDQSERITESLKELKSELINFSNLHNNTEIKD